MPTPEYNLTKNERLGVVDVIGGKCADVLRRAAQHGAYNICMLGSVALGEASLGSGHGTFSRTLSARNGRHSAVIQPSTSGLGNANVTSI